MLPFTPESFFAVFATYNEAVWPAQVLLYGLAVGMVALAFGESRRAPPMIPFGLAFLWAWSGVLYHWAEFTTINRLAWGFGAVFLIEALLFLWSGMTGRLAVKVPRGWRGWTGGALVLYALVLYPLLGLAGHPIEEVPWLGVPCPTTIFTFGLLFWATGRVPRRLLVIPLLWAALGASAAFLLGVWQDLGLVAAGLLGLTLFREPGKALDGAAP